MADISSWDHIQVKTDLIRANRECSQRRLLNSAKWSAELAFALNVQLDPKLLIPNEESPDFLKEYHNYTLATSYFDLKEYDRAAFFLQDCKASKCYFLHMYSRYMADEKRKIDDAPDSIGPPDRIENEHLKTLRIELSKKYSNRELDGFCLYLYGVVLKKLDLTKEAVEVLVQAVNREPLHWGSWQELATLVSDKDMLLTLPLPNIWIKQLFMGLVYLELQLNEEALQIYHNLEGNGFARSTYVVAQIAFAYHNMRDLDAALNSFGELQKLDPYRLENMDLYSNILYVKEMRCDLAHLAHKCVSINKYKVETCCVIGNYYSLRSQHEKAALYFQRCIKLNPRYLSAWTLLGHEYVEMKNTNAAIQAYRQAVEVNKGDYRAWYGLGQAYEILKMPYYCLYYYRMAQKLRPYDSRMVMALGIAYEKLERLVEAKKCFWKAHRMGDVEGNALLKLAKLHERLQEHDQAAGAYTHYIKDALTMRDFHYEGQSEAYKYLANFHLKYGDLESAYSAAQKCAEFTETREEAKGLLKQIQNMREGQQKKVTLPDDSFGSITNNDSFTDHNQTPVMNFTPMSLRFNTP